MIAKQTPTTPGLYFFQGQVLNATNPRIAVAAYQVPYWQSCEVQPRKGGALHGRLVSDHDAPLHLFVGEWRPGPSRLVKFVDAAGEICAAEYQDADGDCINRYGAATNDGLTPIEPGLLPGPGRDGGGSREGYEVIKKPQPKPREIQLDKPIPRPPLEGPPTKPPLENYGLPEETYRDLLPGEQAGEKIQFFPDGGVVVTPLLVPPFGGTHLLP